MNLHLEQNVDLLLIENTNLQDQVKTLSKKLATQNLKYNSLSNVVETQTAFMREIETKVETIARREKPLREEVDRLRRERNDAVGKIHLNLAKCKLLDAEKQEISASRRRMEEENVWLVEQLHLSRRVGQDMEALVSARLDLQKTRDGQKVPTDLGERIHELHIEKTRLEHDKQDLLQRVNVLSKDLTNASQIADEWKVKCILLLIVDFKELSVSKTLLSEKENLRSQLNALMSQRTADDRENEERLKYLQSQIQALGLLQTKNMANNNGLSPWPQSQQTFQEQTRASVFGRASVSPEQSPKLTKRASFYDSNQVKNENSATRSSQFSNEPPAIDKFSRDRSSSKARDNNDLRNSISGKEARDSKVAANTRVSTPGTGEQAKRASFYQKPSLANITDSQEDESYSESRGRAGYDQHEANGLSFQPKREVAGENNASMTSTQPPSALKKPSNTQSHLPVSTASLNIERHSRNSSASPVPKTDYTKPVSVFQGQTSKLILSPKIVPQIVENPSPTLSRPSSLKKTRIPSPTRLSRASSFAESDNEHAKSSSARKSGISRTRADSVNSQPSKPKVKHILSGGEVIPIRPRTNSASGAHLFNGPNPGERPRTKSNASTNSNQAQPNPFFAPPPASDAEEGSKIPRFTDLGTKSPEQALQSLDLEIKALESLLFK